MALTLACSALGGVSANVTARRRVAECAGEYGDCTQSHCCSVKDFGCFRRPDRPYAQCRPLDKLPCVDDSSWKCPGWELCGKRFDACTGSRCCQDDHDRCFAKTGGYAQCLAKDGCVGKVGADGTKWLCTELVPAQGCTDNWQDCTASRCCVSEGYNCYLKHATFAQCMNKCDPGDALCTPHDKSLASRAAAPPAAAPPSLCSTPEDPQCTHSRCCANKAYSCYEKAEHYAQCLKTSDTVCRERWGDAASCEVLQPLTQCGNHPGADCTYSACCEGEYHCYMKDWTLSRCMKFCDTSKLDGEWSCFQRDHKLLTQPPPPPPPAYHATPTFRCRAFRERANNIKHRACSDLPLDLCSSSYQVVEGVYTPCVESRGVCAHGDALSCDCELLNKNCPVAPPVVAQHSTQGHAGQAQGAPAAAASAELGVDSFELGVVVVSVVVVVLSCFAAAWMCCLRKDDQTETMDELEMDEPKPHRKRRPNKSEMFEDDD